MAQLSDQLVGILDDMALEMREIFEERGHNVNGALAQDRAFTRNKRSRSSLNRDLISEAFETASSRVGLHCRPGPGGSVELQVQIPAGFAVIRLRGAKQVMDELHIPANNASTWGGIDEDALVREYPYVFGYEISGDAALALFVAEVVDVIEGTPGRLVLGPATFFGGQGISRQFEFVTDDDERLPGFDDEELDSEVVA